MLLDKCIEYELELLIPGMDDDAMRLSESIEMFGEAGIQVLVSGVELMRLCRDKARTSSAFNEINEIFVKSYARADLEDRLRGGEVKFPLIAKPIDGFSSRGITILRDWKDLSLVKENHIIQEIAIPRMEDPHNFEYCEKLKKGENPQVSEISIQLVANKTGKLLGRMASYNKLKNGVPIEILPYENKCVWREIDKLIPTLAKLGMRGPLNIQGRQTDDGLKLFEINPRFTGITGLRALMGFNEVEACIKEWLRIPSAKTPLMINYNRFGVRQPGDKAVCIKRNDMVSKQSSLLNKEMKISKPTLLVTGAAGYLGRSLVKKVLNEGQYQILAMGRDKQKLEQLFQPIGQVTCYDMADFRSGVLSFGLVDTIVHCAFGRPHCTLQEIADSLEFTNQVLMQAAINQVPRIVNISSQSVYGLSSEPMWNEETPAAPETPYAQAKYASELMTSNARWINNQTYVTSLRLATLSGGQDGLVPAEEMTTKFVLQVIKGEAIRIQGGGQCMERLDIRDAVTGILAVLKMDASTWHSVYNLGYGKAYNIVHIAEKVLALGKKHNYKKSSLVIEPQEVNMKFGMDNRRLMKDSDWAPQHSLEDIIESLYEQCARAFD
jgi:nucleoside-diphosphate-sugar epimerase